MESTSREVDDLKPPKMFYVWGELGDFPPMHGENVMISAGSAWNNPPKGDGFNAFIIPNKELFIDSGGFQAAKWQKYPYSAEEYMNWAESVGADYVAGMDFACEPEISEMSVKDRLKKTIGNQVRQMDVYEANDYNFKLVPVIQGSTLVSQYLESIDKLNDRGLITDYVGVGSLCLRKSVKEIYEVVKAISEEIDSRLHLFGAKVSILKKREFWGKFYSSDTAAWKFLPSNARPEGGMYVRNKREKEMAFRTYRAKVGKYQDAIRGQTQIKTLEARNL